MKTIIYEKELAGTLQYPECKIVSYYTNDENKLKTTVVPYVFKFKKPKTTKKDGLNIPFLPILSTDNILYLMNAMQKARLDLEACDNFEKEVLIAKKLGFDTIMNTEKVIKELKDFKEYCDANYLTYDFAIMDPVYKTIFLNLEKFEENFRCYKPLLIEECRDNVFQSDLETEEEFDNALINNDYGYDEVEMLFNPDHEIDTNSDEFLIHCYGESLFEQFAKVRNEIYEIIPYISTSAGRERK